MNKTPEYLGRYKLIRELGRGGMSVVYLARDSELGREVAIKCVGPGATVKNQLAERLQSEAKLLAQLNHPHVVQLYDVIQQEGILGLVIEYVGGETLTQRLNQAPSRETKLKWLSEVAEGLASAHQKGIAHCDLKADNILITDNNVAKIADFGIAKVKLDDYIEGDGLTRVDSVSGSYLSLSPEQASGEPVDTRTDLFSLGVLIFQTLTSEHPFGDTNNKIALIQRIVNTPFELDNAAQSKLGIRLAELVKALLKKSPQERLYAANDAALLLRNDTTNTSQDSGLEDQTIEIPVQKPGNAAQPREYAFGLGGKIALLLTGFVAGVIVLKMMPWQTTHSQKIDYVALEKITVTSGEGFNEKLLPLIESSLQQSAENTILSFESTGLVDARELNSANGNYSEKAKASGVKTIVSLTAHCANERCDIKIQRRAGEQMAVANQTVFPVASNSLLEVGNAVARQLPQLFKDSKLSGFDRRDIKVNERNYRRYLELYVATQSGRLPKEEHLADVEDFIADSPDFIPIYTLAYRMASYLNQNTGDDQYLERAKRIFDAAPKSIENDAQVSRSRINLLLALNKPDEAKARFKALKESMSNELFLSEIESSIALNENDYKKLLQLDRQNATWRPSFNNLYNLAYSEFFYGSPQRARQAIDQSLQLIPNEPYAINLKANLALSQGNLDEAIASYESLLSSGTADDDSDFFSNYGVALALNKDYPAAIINQQVAIKINPGETRYYLNLADGYKLNGQNSLATENYAKVLSLIEDPSSAQDYSDLAQAQAHLGRVDLAVRTLKAANQKFPEYAEMDYASAIVNTLAGNHVSAMVDVSDALENGTAPIWFSFEWFRPLCGQEPFVKSAGKAITSLCSPEIKQSD